MTAGGMTAPGRRKPFLRRWYFPVASGAMLALTIIGFSDNLFTNIGQPSNGDPKFIVHGLLCLAWMIALTTQAALIARADTARHRQLGQIMAAIAIGVALSTLYIFWIRWDGWAALDAESKANRLLLPSYAVAIWLGFHARRRPDRHRRLMMIGSFYMLGPVIARTFDPIVVPPLAAWPVATVDALFAPYFALLWFAFFLSLAWYDWVVDARVHPVTGWGGLWMGVVWLIALTV